MPSWPIAMPSSTAMVLNSLATPPAAATSAATSWPRSFRCTCPGTNCVNELTIATIGLPKSPSFIPVARHRARAPAMLRPEVLVNERKVGMRDILPAVVHTEKYNLQSRGIGNPDSGSAATQVLHRGGGGEEFLARREAVACVAAAAVDAREGTGSRPGRAPARPQQSRRRAHARRAGVPRRDPQRVPATRACAAESAERGGKAMSARCRSGSCPSRITASCRRR